MSEQAVNELQVDGVGLVELPGTGPWRVHEVTRSSFDIQDATGAITNPHVTPLASAARRGTKRSMNVIYASKSIPNAIVARFNAELERRLEQAA